MPAKAMLFFVLAVLPAPAGAWAADLSGTWAVKADLGPQLKYSLLCILRSDGNSLSGSCADTQGPTLRTTGRLDGSKLHLKYFTDYNSSGVHLAYSGHAEADGTFKGSIDDGHGSSGVFQAKPLTAPDSAHSAPWKIDGAFSDSLRYVLLCTFKSDGERIAGPCAAIDGPTLLASGTSDGAKLTMAYDTEYQGRPAHVAYTGALQPDGSMRGTINSGTASGSFTAEKQ